MSAVKKIKKIEEEILGGAFLRNTGSGGVEILDTHPGDPLDVEENPFFPAVMNQDGGAREAYYDYEQTPTPTGAGPIPPSIEPPAVVPAHSDAQMKEISEREAAREAGLEEDAPWSRINPRTAQVGVLGGTALITQTDVDANRLIQVARWEGDNVETLPVSISISPLPLQHQATSPGATLSPFARINFGTRDGRHSVDVDLGMGAQLTVPASNVYVELGIQPGSTPLQGDYGVSASIGYYAIERTAPLTYTSVVKSLTAGSTSDALTRPNYAAQLMNVARTADLVGTAAPGPAITVIVLDYGLFPIDVFTIGMGATLTAPYTLPNNCFAIKLVNGGANTINAFAVWGLAI